MRKTKNYEFFRTSDWVNWHYWILCLFIEGWKKIAILSERIFENNKHYMTTKCTYYVIQDNVFKSSFVLKIDNHYFWRLVLWVVLESSQYFIIQNFFSIAIQKSQKWGFKSENLFTIFSANNFPNKYLDDKNISRHVMLQT